MFVPALSPNFELDHLLLPYAERLADAALISAAECGERRFRTLQVPLWLDSGGFAAFAPGSCVREEGGLGILSRPHAADLSPQSVYDLAEQLGAAAEFTLDFPTRNEQDRLRLFRLGEANALWRLSRPRNRLIYAAVQPGQPLGTILAAQPDGLALGGLVPLAGNPQRLEQEIRAVRAQMPEQMPLHVFGLGKPDLIKLALNAGATSTDSSSPQRTAVSGKGWNRSPVTSPSEPERLELATQNLHSSVNAGKASSEQPAAKQRNQLLTLPTGGGKTYRAGQAAGRALEAGGKVIVIAPTIALIEEIAEDWARRYPQYQVQAYSHRSAHKRPYRSAQIIVMSGERLDLVTRRWKRHWDWLPHVTLAVIDEFHLIREPGRGPALEAGLIRLHMLNPLCRLMLLTATCGNPEDICTWLDAEHVHSDHRPVPLVWNAVKSRNKTQTLWKELDAQDGKTLVFVHSRARAQSLSTEAQKRGYQAAAPCIPLPLPSGAAREAGIYTVAGLFRRLRLPQLASGKHGQARKSQFLFLPVFFRPDGTREPAGISEVWKGHPQCANDISSKAACSAESWK
ncbi:MAG: DEAD/DEAH box helicase [Deinococcus sp.]|nr:DEAD/DEAH box helicase [Deinococcus sp.]